MFSEPPVQLWVLVLSFVFIPIIAFLLLRKSTGYVRPLYSTPPTTPLTSPLTTPNTEANPLPDNGSIVEERRLQQEQPDVTSSPSNSSAFQASLPFYVASMSSSDSSTSSFASANPPSFQASDLDGEDLPVSPLEGGDAVRVRRYPPEGDTSFSGNYQHHFQSFPHRPCQVDGETDTLTGASGSPPPYTPTDIRNQSGFRGNGCQRGPNEEASRTSEERLRTRQVVEDVEVNRGSILPTHPSADLQYSSSEYFPSTIEAESFN